MKKNVAIFLLICLLMISFLFLSSYTSANSIVRTGGCINGPYGAIGEVYEAYGEKSENHPLGLPTSEEKDFITGNDISCGADQDKFQEFQHGSIYYNQQERTAFALFNDVDVYYKTDRTSLGFPISSEIGNANIGTCKAYFQGGYLLCDGSSDPGDWVVDFWDQLSLAEITEILFIPELEMPFRSAQTAYFNAGPHAWDLGGVLDASYALGQGSGIDIGMRGAAFDVLAMASGTVVELYPDPEDEGYIDCQNETSGLGCWVAIRNDFSGTVIIYGHIQPNPDLRVGHWVRQGNYIGDTTDGIIGSSGGPHVHVEFRTGISDCHSHPNCPSGLHQSDYGDPFDWHGVVVGEYLISSGVDSSGMGLNYDGTAVEINPFEVDPNRKHSQENLLLIWGNQNSYIYKDFLFYEPNHSTPKQINSWVTLAASNTCESLYEGVCESGYSYDGTVFSYGGFTSSNSRDFEEMGLENYPLLNSANEYSDFVPRYRPEYPNPVPTATQNNSGNDCPTDNREGIYLYSDQQYQGDCTYSVDDIPNLADTSVGDNRLSSIEIIGDWKAQLLGALKTCRIRQLMARMLFGQSYHHLKARLLWLWQL